jgi:hypothetical protein
MITALQEIFPTWSSSDLHQVLSEAGGDVEVAVSRITSGILFFI